MKTITTDVGGAFTVLTERSEVHGASTEMLSDTIFALTGLRPPEKMERAMLERRADHELMLAEEARNHRGVPKWGPPPDISFPGLVANLCKANESHDAMSGKVAPPRPAVVGYRVTGAGTSKVQVGSVRGAVLRWFQAQPNGTATQAQADEHFGHPCNGHIQKLLAASHLERVAL